MYKLLIPILLFGSLSINAQTDDLIQLTNKRYINDDKNNITFHLSDKIKKRYSPSKKRMYYWYKSQEIINTQGGYSGQLLDGNYIAYHDNMQLKEKGRFKNGLKTGKWTSWLADGKISSIEVWWNGRKVRSIKKF